MDICVTVSLCCIPDIKLTPCHKSTIKEKSKNVTGSVIYDFVTPRTVACQAPLSTEFPRQVYCSGLLFSSPRNLPDPGTEPSSPTLQANSLPSEPPGKQSPGLRGIHFLASLGFPGLIKLYLQSELTILQCLLSFGVAHFCCLCAH